MHQMHHRKRRTNERDGRGVRGRNRRRSEWLWRAVSLRWFCAGVIALAGIAPATMVAAQETEDQTRLTDANIAETIESELTIDQAVPSTRVDVTVADGIATLTGRVSHVLAKDRALAIAETVKGVRAVVNQIKVEPAVERSDSRIADDVTTALGANPATESFDVRVRVDDGVVTLQGTVESWQEKQLSERVAKGVIGVRSVVNNIDVEYTVERTDADIAADIREALRWDVRIDDALIDVAVDDGNVTLSGTVGSAAEKRLAQTSAWVIGVNDVSADALRVESWARDEKFRKDKYVDKSDEAIEQAVRDAMVYDPRVSSYNVQVAVEDGTVTLTGDVPSVEARRAAAQTARNAIGVYRVRNWIDVLAPAMTDESIAEAARAALERDPYVNRFEVDVAVYDGEVSLSGTVDSTYEKMQAENAVASVAGATDVNNYLTVRDESPPPITYDPYVDDFDFYGYDWFGYEAPGISDIREDWQIAEQIRDELWWSPFVDSDEVTVSVDDGVATLTGTVDTWSERQAAAENAREGGARVVNNDLKIEYGPNTGQ